MGGDAVISDGRDSASRRQGNDLWVNLWLRKERASRGAWLHYKSWSAMMDSMANNERWATSSIFSM